jgi:Zn-dependent peptidase ImmA (M78 family)/transcriptional regulator with XRE-family HTH domain
METFNQAVFTSVLAARHLTLKGISERLGLSETQLRQTIRDNPRPNQSIISQLSTQLSVPAFVFYMDHAPELNPDIVDFRQTQPVATPKLPQTVKAIALAQRLHEVATELGHEDTLPRNVTLAHIKSAEFAKHLRVDLGISLESQTQANDAAQFYAICRAAVEQSGVFVLHSSFPSEDGSGFCLADGPSRFVVINTRRQNHSRRNFTLFHELAHLLMGKSGVSDPFVTNNAIERACNTFAAQLLVPETLARAVARKFSVFGTPSVDIIRRCAKFLNVSQQATVIRLENLSLISAGAHDRWLAEIQEIGNPDFDSKRGGGGNVAQERVKLAKYGYTFAHVFGQAVDRSRISPLDLYRMSGLKPKYQRPYFEFAATASAADVADADDE